MYATSFSLNSSGTNRNDDNLCGRSAVLVPLFEEVPMSFEILDALNTEVSTSTLSSENIMSNASKKFLISSFTSGELAR